MFLPSTSSFLLIRVGRSSTKPSFPVFLPNTHSFLLTRKSVVNPDFSPQTVVEEQIDVSDQGKRNFLKVAGVVGAGVLVSQLAPKKASAFIMGSSPTTGVVGVKNASNARINPATEETLDEVLKTTDLSFDTGSLNVKVTSLPASGSSSFSDSGNVDRKGLVDAVTRNVQVDVLELPATATTETTLQTISFGGFKFTLRLVSVGDVDYVGEATIGTTTSSSAWRIKKVDSTSGTAVTWAGTGVFDQVWDNRASLSYS